MTKNAGGWNTNSSSIKYSQNNRTRGILTISPHNPTGMIINKNNFPAFSQGLPIICDEVFSEFCWNQSYCPALGSFISDIPIFHLNGISKMFALPDLKLGWIALNDVAAMQYGDRLEILNDTFLGANSFSQYILELLFLKGQDFIAEMRARIFSNLMYASNLIDSIHGFHAIRPEGGYYLVVQYDLPIDEEEMVVGLIHEGVVTYPGYFFGDFKFNSFVISCLSDQETITKLGQALISVSS
ncbi:MAG: pyridoxal phosphate-dependent aminotransferase [Deltaproteobacteria bacterium]|nr:pyridoxal phosphate-dependent aminotransferase [Deltaproteobacteria bacterium]